MYNTTRFTIEKNGLTLNCLQYSGDTSCVKSVILALHGFAGHMDSNAIKKMAERFIEEDAGTVLMSFDLPGHGTDKERLSLELCDRYTTAAVEYLREQYEGAELILYGTSFGGYLALKYLNEHPDVFSLCILRCPAVRMYETLHNDLLTDAERKKLEEGGVIEIGFDRVVEIRQDYLDDLNDHPVFDASYKKYADRILILQGLCDETVKCEEVIEFARKNGIRLVLSKDADHRFLAGNSLAESLEECVKFLGSRLGS